MRASLLCLAATLILATTTWTPVEGMMNQRSPGQRPVRQDTQPFPGFVPQRIAYFKQLGQQADDRLPLQYKQQRQLRRQQTVARLGVPNQEYDKMVQKRKNEMYQEAGTMVGPHNANIDTSPQAQNAFAFWKGMDQQLLNTVVPARKERVVNRAKAQGLFNPLRGGMTPLFREALEKRATPEVVNHVTELYADIEAIEEVTEEAIQRGEKKTTPDTQVEKEFQQLRDLVKNTLNSETSSPVHLGQPSAVAFNAHQPPVLATDPRQHSSLASSFVMDVNHDGVPDNRGQPAPGLTVQQHVTVAGSQQNSVPSSIGVDVNRNGVPDKVEIAREFLAEHNRVTMHWKGAGNYMRLKEMDFAKGYSAEELLKLEGPSVASRTDTQRQAYLVALAAKIIIKRIKLQGSRNLFQNILNWSSTVDTKITSAGKKVAQVFAPSTGIKRLRNENVRRGGRVANLAAAIEHGCIPVDLYDHYTTQFYARLIQSLTKEQEDALLVELKVIDGNLTAETLKNNRFVYQGIGCQQIKIAARRDPKLSPKARIPAQNLPNV